jgi:hypothetical protein
MHAFLSSALAFKENLLPWREKISRRGAEAQRKATDMEEQSILPFLSAFLRLCVRFFLADVI